MTKYYNKNIQRKRTPTHKDDIIIASSAQPLLAFTVLYINVLYELMDRNYLNHKEEFV